MSTSITPLKTSEDYEHIYQTSFGIRVAIKPSDWMFYQSLIDLRLNHGMSRAAHVMGEVHFYVNGYSMVA